MLTNDAIIQSYVSVCNKALSLNKDRFPFKQILGAAKQSGKGKMVEVNIDHSDPRESFVFTIENGQIIAKPHESCANCRCDKRWKINRHYLEEVISHPQDFINNPAKINWEWIYDA